MVIDQTSPQGTGVAAYLYVYHQFCMMLLQTDQEALDLKEIFQNIHFKFLDALDHLQNHPTEVEDPKSTTTQV